MTGEGTVSTMQQFLGALTVTASLSRWPTGPGGLAAADRLAKAAEQVGR